MTVCLTWHGSSLDIESAERRPDPLIRGRQTSGRGRRGGREERRKRTDSALSCQERLPLMNHRYDIPRHRALSVAHHGSIPINKAVNVHPLSDVVPGNYLYSPKSRGEYAETINSAPFIDERCRPRMNYPPTRIFRKIYTLKHAL